MKSAANPGGTDAWQSSTRRPPAVRNGTGLEGADLRNGAPLRRRPFLPRPSARSQPAAIHDTPITSPNYRVGTARPLFHAAFTILDLAAEGAVGTGSDAGGNGIMSPTPVVSRFQNFPSAGSLRAIFGCSPGTLLR